MTRLAIFDCDGTLIDSQASICRAMATTFVEAGLRAPPATAVRRVVGLSLAELVAVLLPDGDDALHQAITARYRVTFQRMRARGEVLEPLFDGIATVLDRLTVAGWLLGVATGKSDRGLAHALATHGLTDRFVTLQTADRHPSKPHPAMVEAAMSEAGVVPDQTVVIGDTSFDIEMAHAAGARAIGVGWGYHPVAELRRAGAHTVVAHPLDLIAVLEAL